MSDSVEIKDAPVEVNEEWCKGCYICVDFCPTGVLEIINYKAVVMYPEKCTQCMLCELRCPDFAIKVKKKGKK